MVENWIKVEPHCDDAKGKKKQILCKVTFSDSVSVILDDEDVKTLSKKLEMFLKFKKIISGVKIDG